MQTATPESEMDRKITFELTVREAAVICDFYDRGVDDADYLVGLDQGDYDEDDVARIAEDKELGAAAILRLIHLKNGDDQ